MSGDTERPVTMRTSERGAATRVALLDAAKETFITSGFAEAGVTDVVARAGASVGSLYHHFSGKADLYLTLFEEFQKRQTQRTRQAVQEARAAGETDPMPQFLAAARAYLEGCLEERDLAALFLRGDAPPGFEVIMRDRLRQWARRTAALFEHEDALVVVVTGALAAVVQEVTLSEDPQHARRIAEDALRIIGEIRHP
ncbi:TetR/AcrR family transcriptional regulator [Microbispora hainanensis]|jgi:AcrR family transcriptional regulator|uniref:TetR/AcrR family transcriptional regulator n=1 Tax=Microbispora hainanensis TaxID=568844 RepID=A0ABZ1SPD7_9ACTN|nr:MULTISPECIES: TetR/AcrR family transcriptional regulator [Microbispora]NJP27942.1 TetR/AcrR family transcriptional regulator [Microbispora sp. CL1-1]TQS10470.1 TetR/AcrR family transcriptional regulator [Microbispora sp. SCL1-1]